MEKFNWHISSASIFAHTLKQIYTKCTLNKYTLKDTLLKKKHVGKIQLAYLARTGQHICAHPCRHLFKTRPFQFQGFQQSDGGVGWLFDQFLLSTISQFICIQSFGSTFLTLFHIVLNIKTLPRWYRIISKWTDDNGAGGGLGFPIYMEIVISLKASAIQRCD